MISIIVAVGERNEIGIDNKLPWSMPADLAYFKKITTGHPILMGRKTYESIGRPLPNRKNIVLTRQKEYQPNGVEVIHNIQAVQEYSKNAEVFVIGGAELFREYLPITKKLYLTKIHGTFEADTYFPTIEKEEWKQIAVEHHQRDEKNNYDYSFYVFERVRD